MKNYFHASVSSSSIFIFSIYYDGETVINRDLCTQSSLGARAQFKILNYNLKMLSFSGRPTGGTEDTISMFPVKGRLAGIMIYIRNCNALRTKSCVCNIQKSDINENFKKILNKIGAYGKSFPRSGRDKTRYVY